MRIVLCRPRPISGLSSLAAANRQHGAAEKHPLLFDPILMKRMAVAAAVIASAPSNWVKARAKRSGSSPCRVLWWKNGNLDFA